MAEQARARTYIQYLVQIGMPATAASIAKKHGIIFNRSTLKRAKLSGFEAFAWLMLEEENTS